MASVIQTVPSAVRNAWWATIGLFLLHGLIVATWVSRIPAIQTALRLSNGVLGLTLLNSALGAMVAIPLTGMLVNRYGSKKISSISTIVFPIVLIGPALAFNAITLALALFLYGAVAAVMDVSMNAQGVEVEKRLRAPTMSRFHAMFSLGAMIGAGIGGLIAARAISSLVHFAASSAIYLVAGFLVIPYLFETHETVQPAAARLPLNKIPRLLFALSAIGFCMLLAEGAMADWTAVYLRQVLSADAGIAAAGYSVFSAAMAIFRFVGDWVTAQLGAWRAVLVGSLTGACGLLWALAANSPAWSLPGFALVGAGFSIIIPLIFGGGGRVPNVSPGAGIATVTGIGYIGFIVGPPVIGFASQLFTLRYALGIVVLCCLISAALSPSLREVQPGESSGMAPEPC